tara:strand:- start:299 stop:1102 length:804 start_codon:yes stop_codon:yes gene_type:complete
MTLNRSAVIDPKVEKQIMKTLTKIEENHDVQILHAAESGSRAWGFHSPNSDYDVRFLYVHERDWYLSIYPGRDVIELPINETYDVSGWDLKKTLHLAMKSNAVVMEWLQSPIIYKTSTDFTESLKTFCGDCFHTKALMYHYINLGTRQIDQTWRTTETTQIKKYFYMIRPAMALRWLAENKGSKLAPMNIQDLMDGGNVPQAIRDMMDDLIAQKMACEEKTETKRIKTLDDFIMQEYSAAEERAADMSAPEKEMGRRADDLFRSWLV